jgi:hypothetical protein
MTICAVILLYLNRQKSAIIKGYEEMCKKNGQINTRIAETISDKTDQHQAIIDGLEKDWKEMSEMVDDYKKRLEKQRKENEVLRKYAADFTPMKSMADYTEKIQYFSEQAEDMFGLYIDTIRLERGNTMFCRYWKVDMKTSGCKKPKDDIEKV